MTHPRESQGAEPGGPRAASRRHRAAAPAIRLYETSFPIRGTLAETYLRTRGLRPTEDWTMFRFHPNYYLLDGDRAPGAGYPILIAPVTDQAGGVVGVHRTWLSPHGKAAIPMSARHQQFGNVMGNAVRFGSVSGVLAIGIGIESILSLRLALPEMPMVAALTPALAAAFVLPTGLERLVIVTDGLPGPLVAHLAEAAGHSARMVSYLKATSGDFSEDLRGTGEIHLKRNVATQLCAGDPSEKQ